MTRVQSCTRCRGPSRPPAMKRPPASIPRRRPPRWSRGPECLVQERTTNLLDGMVAVLDYRDTETQWHSRRVARFTRRIAEELGMKDEQQLDTIERGSLLHDIGKIGVRDAVLLKPGPLDASGWSELREHPRLGWAL